MMSFLAWLTPDFGFLRKGFQVPQELVGYGLALLLGWYGSIIAITFAAYKVGRLFSLKTSLFDRYCPLHDPLTYGCLSLVSAAGCSYLLYFLYVNVGLRQMFDFITTGQANELKMAIYADYSVGPLSLRYVAILTGGLALYRIVSRISHSPLDFLNIFFLLATTLVSSRLSLIHAVLIAVILYLLNNPQLQIKWRKPLLAAAVLFILLGIANYTRNSNFYADRGNTGFFDAALGEIISYLGTPFQGSLAAGNNFTLWIQGQSGYYFSGIDAELQTNSALLDIPSENGPEYFIEAFFLFALAAFVIGFLYRQHRNHLMLVSCVLLYCFSEIWRIFMFTRGIVMVLLFFSLTVPCAVTLLRMMAKHKNRKTFVDFYLENHSK